MEKPQMMPAMKVADVAQRLGVSPKTVYRLIASGDMKSVRVGRSVRVTHDQLAAFLSCMEG